MFDHIHLAATSAFLILVSRPALSRRQHATCIQIPSLIFVDRDNSTVELCYSSGKPRVGQSAGAARQNFSLFRSVSFFPLFSLSPVSSFSLCRFMNETQRWMGRSVHSVSGGGSIQGFSIPCQCFSRFWQQISTRRALKRRCTHWQQVIATMPRLFGEKPGGILGSEIM